MFNLYNYKFMKKKWFNDEGPYRSLFKWLRVMKLTVFFLLTALIHVSASVYSQQTKLSISLKDATVRDVLRTIEDQSDFFFLYKNENIDVNRIVNVDIKEQSVEYLLNQIFKGTTVSYEVVNRQIVLVDKEKDNFYSPSQQQKTISGKVTDSSGGVVPGVSIVVKGTTTGSTTDMNGNYSLSNVPGNATLQFSFVGMKTQEIAVGSKTTIDVTLEEDAIGLEEVVAVGYGVQKRLTVTGSVVSTKGTDLVRSPAPNLTNSLQGRLPGLIASNRSGEPGRDDATLLIRGKSTTGNTKPLIVIDGVERDGLGQIDPNDVESISVLKDASAAIYGARAANGVILVTTKRGLTGKPVFDLSYNQGFSQPTRLPEMMDAALYAQTRNEADLRNGATSFVFSEDDIQKYKDGSDPMGHPNTDWVKETLKPWTLQNKMNLSVRGGNDKVKYFFSFGSQNQDGHFVNNPTNYKQYNVRSNIDATITKSLTISLDIAGRYEKRTYPSTDTWTNFVNILSAEPTLIAKYPNGLIAAGRLGENPLLRDQVGTDKIENFPITSTLSFKYDLPFVKGLALSGSYNFDVRHNFEKVFQKPYYYYDYNKTTDTYDAKKASLFSSPTVSDRFDRWLISTYNLKLNYNKSFGSHNIALLAGWEQSHTLFNYTSAYRKNFASIALPQINYGSTNTADQSNGGNASEDARNNYFGRFNYNYKEKYLIELLCRYDGSPNFPKEKRYGFFPGLSLGWRASEESFIKDNFDFISNLKLRASYGEMGNDRVNAFQYMTTYSFGDNYNFGGVDVGGVSANTMPNANITWEVAKTTNMGFDMSMWNNLLGVEFDYFIQKRSNILATKQQSIPSTMGFPGLPDENIGKIDNHGFELALSHRNKIGEIGYNVSGNVSFARNKVIFTDEVPQAELYQNATGHPLGSQLIYKVLGIFKDQAAIDAYPHLTNAKPGDVILEDHNDDQKIDSKDQYRIDLSTTPEIVFGLDLGVDYKGFDLTLFFQGQANAVIFPGLTTVGGQYNGLKMRAEGRWTVDNPDATLPRAGGSFPQNSTLNQYSASFVRLKNLEIGYKLPKSMISKVKMEGARIYVNAYNVFTISKLKILDPEMDPTKNDLNNYPQLRTFNVGVNLTF